ncbi:MAG: hypothetical protein V4548_00275 [Bacteroidota bacterium]
MNKHQNTNNYSFRKSENQNHNQGLLMPLFVIKEFLNFDESYSKVYQEKLQIIYANIRV